MQRVRKEVRWIAAAFLLLCLISLYRQIGMRFFPYDPIRPVIVYFVYLLLLAVWWAAIRNRVTQRNFRGFLMAEQAVMLFGITVRFLQDAFSPYFTGELLLYDNPFFMRLSGNSLIVPIALFPLFGLYASLGLGKTEDYSINRKWYYLLIPAVALVVLTLTNEIHNFVFVTSEDDLPNFHYHPNVGFYIITAFALSLILVRIFLIYKRSREQREYKHLRIVPFLIAVFMLLYTIPYAAASFVVSIELIEFYVTLFFLEAMIWESSIMIGLVKVNTRYKDVFDRSTIAMQIVHEDGQPCLKSADAPELSEDVFNELKRCKTVRTPDNQDLHLHAIKGGYVVWKNDVSRTLAVIDKLLESNEKLESEGEFLGQELKIRSDDVAVKEQNRIYNRLTDEVGKQLSLMRDLLATRDYVADRNSLFKKICLIATYIKRRCNLRLIEQSDGMISNKDLELCYLELLGYFSQMGVDAEVFWDEYASLTSEFAIFTLDVLELLLEHEQFEISSMKVTLEADNAFSIQIYPDIKSLNSSPEDKLKQMNKDHYLMMWHPFKKGYQVSFRCEKGE